MEAYSLNKFELIENVEGVNLLSKQWMKADK